jgi:hypothetical protein
MSNVIVIDKDLLKSEAFRTLNGQAKTVLLDFLMKRRVKQVKIPGGMKMPMILNNGEIQYSYKEAFERGITRPAFARALDVLIQRGFIDIAKQGSGGKHRDASLYSISERWRKWGQEDFDPGKLRVKDTRGGRGFARYWQKRKDEEFEAIFGNDSFTDMSKQNVTPKSDFEGDFEVSSKQNVTPIKGKKQRKAASASEREALEWFSSLE